MSKGKLITRCGECVDYDYKKHRCKRGCHEGEPQEPFYADCPLPDAPTADVAQRAEIANKICCEIEEEIVAALESNYRALKEWDDGRCNDYILEMANRIKGKIDALRGIEGFVEELKKKYTEDKS